MIMTSNTFVPTIPNSYQPSLFFTHCSPLFPGEQAKLITSLPSLKVESFAFLRFVNLPSPTPQTTASSFPIHIVVCHKV